MDRGSTTVTDEELGAYVDGELDRAERMAVEAALHDDPLLMGRARALRHVSMLVRAASRAAIEVDDDAAREDAGHRLRATRGQAWRGRMRWAAGGLKPLAASFATGFVVAISAILLLQAPRESTGDWQQLTLALHQRFVDALQEGREFPLDVADRDPGRVGAFLAPTIGYTPSIPDLSAEAYELNGARVIMTLDGPVVYALYTSAVNPLLGFVAMRREPSADQAAGTVARAPVKLVSWRRGAAQFAFVGTHSAAELERLAATYGDASSLRE